jgi:hypothetical protein
LQAQNATWTHTKPARASLIGTSFKRHVLDHVDPLTTTSRETLIRRAKPTKHASRSKQPCPKQPPKCAPRRNFIPVTPSRPKRPTGGSRHQHKWKQW